MKIKVDKESAVLVLSKEQWLLIFSLDNEVTVEHFSFDKRIAGKFCLRNYFSFNLMTSSNFHMSYLGLEIMNDFSVFVTLLNFKSFLVNPFKEGEREPIPLSLPTNIKNHRCSGVSFSRNREFCVFSVK